MSLINQMLRDLEHRQSVQSNHVPELQVKTALKKSGHKFTSLRLLLIVISLLPAYLWYKDQGLPLQQLFTNSEQLAASAVQQIPASTISKPVNPVIEPAKENYPVTALAEQTILQSAPPQTIQRLQSQQPQPVIPQAIVSSKHKNPVLDKLIVLPRHTRATSKPVDSLAIKVPSTHDQAVNYYHQAQHQTNIEQIRSNLQSALQLQPEYLPARSQLLLTLLKAKVATGELVDFLDESLELFPENLLFIKTRAHLLVKQKDFASAVNLLTRLNANTVEDPTYLSLLAASYQQLHSFEQAKDIYLRLCINQADKAENWLGLAISYDKLNQYQQASEAYQRALEKNTLNSQVLDYIKVRLSIINK